MSRITVLITRVDNIINPLAEIELTDEVLRTVK